MWRVYVCFCNGWWDCVLVVGVQDFLVSLKLNTGEMEEMVPWRATMVVRFTFYSEAIVVCMSV